MQIFSADQFSIEVGSILESTFQSKLLETYRDSKVVIMVDENTHDCCLEYILTSFDSLQDAEVMLLPVGEENKVMEVCFQVWQALSEYGIGRKDLVINLGGGVVTDMGGFIASIYKRGVDFIHIPTSLLGMVDASIGGKTGIDLGQYKNQLGTFCHPKNIYIDPIFLSTLPEEEFLNGYAEMLKHALIRSKEEWGRLKKISSYKELISLESLLFSIRTKFEIVNNDPQERGERKILNFGHTIGHAIEGYFLDKDPIAHGHAVALGIIAESFISMKRGILSKEEYFDIEFTITSKFPMINLDSSDITEITRLTQNDKKNDKNKVKGCLLSSIGVCTYDVEYSKNEISDSLNNFHSLIQ